jgi:hypothetical protein
MCTLTVVPLPRGRVRVGFNRDEKPARPSSPPARHRFGSREAVFPADHPSGGTWLAVNDAGLAMAVLNVTPPKPHTLPPARSRGVLIPAVVGCDTPADALAELERAIDYRDFAPFRLVLVGRGVVAKVRWDGREPMVTSRLLGGCPLLFTSSGLGDHLVEGVRRDLFDHLFDVPSERWQLAQDEFHRHRWPGREHLSVNMVRPTARTVSFAVIDLDDSAATVTYHPAAPHEPGEPTVVHLPLSPVGVS